MKACGSPLNDGFWGRNLTLGDDCAYSEMRKPVESPSVIQLAAERSAEEAGSSAVCSSSQEAISRVSGSCRLSIVSQFCCSWKILETEVADYPWTEASLNRNNVGLGDLRW